MDAIRHVLRLDPRIAYAILFGSSARGSMHAHSDLDVAIGLASGVTLEAHETGALVASSALPAGR